MNTLHGHSDFHGEFKFPKGPSFWRRCGRDRREEKADTLMAKNNKRHGGRRKDLYTKIAKIIFPRYTKP